MDRIVAPLRHCVHILANWTLTARRTLIPSLQFLIPNPQSLPSRPRCSLPRICDNSRRFPHTYWRRSLTCRDRLRCSPANGPTCRRPSWLASSAVWATTGWNWPAGATTSRSTRRSNEDDYCAEETRAAGKEQPAGVRHQRPPGRARPCWTTSTPGTRPSCRRTSGATAIRRKSTPGPPRN